MIYGTALSRKCAVSPRRNLLLSIRGDMIDGPAQAGHRGISSFQRPIEGRRRTANWLMLLEFFGKQDRFSVRADGNCLHAPLQPGKGVLHQERRPVAFPWCLLPILGAPSPPSS